MWIVNKEVRKNIPIEVSDPVNTVSKALDDGKTVTDIVEKEVDDNREISIQFFEGP